VLSLIATAVSIAYTVYRGLNLGIDFVGGQVVRAEFAQPVHIEDLRARVAQLGVGEASIQALGNNRTYQIRLPRPVGPETASNQVVSKLRTAIPQQFAGARVDAGESVSGKVSEELAQDSATAIALAMLGIAVYIWFRFEWQFGVGALVTLAHDVAMTLGFFAFTRLQVDLNVVAAFLTIVGYSLNDTVVIYDRVRENLRKYRKMAILPLLNLSLNETLARTVVTSFTVLIALGVLMLIGPEVIFGLAIAIFLGVVIGTYSSIYISVPVLVWLGVTPHSFLRADEKDEPEAQPA
jgi:preprotein translocase subunit SecF